ncbi:hypothetical protein [Spiroplasma ixodetis]|uniref:Transposase n=1 Tax=Spiroplasma ixodetis TaxID=2141 RepID=A0ABM8BWJ8_9MOLU|nr:hypothetical protein [Spiroplasma ixodetis]BDT04248.1 hypothetical protein SHM_18940 [Spiroplasma ixodetis]
MDNFYAYIPLILKYIVILPYFLKDSKQVLTHPREKFPKKFIFSKTNKNEVHKFILSLNQRPRKILNYLSPIEYLNRKII